MHSIVISVAKMLKYFYMVFLSSQVSRPPTGLPSISLESSRSPLSQLMPLLWTSSRPETNGLMPGWQDIQAVPWTKAASILIGLRHLCSTDYWILFTGPLAETSLEMSHNEDNYICCHFHWGDLSLKQECRQRLFTEESNHHRMVTILTWFVG